jgi:hypothetical protein
MTYPNTITAFRNALFAYLPADDQADAIHAAQAHASPVVQAVDTFTALRSVDELSQAGLSLLLGSAYLIASGGWHGLAGEATTLIGLRASELIPEDPEAPVVPE